MKVTKRTGELEDVSFDKILKRIEQQCYDLNKNFIDPVEIATKVIQGLSNGIKTSELDILASETAAMMTANHPDFAKLAARITLSNLYKESPSTFSQSIEFISKNSERLNKKLVELVLLNKETIDSKIDETRDEIFDYFGFKTLEKSYLIRIDDKIIERPQYMWMRVALGIWGENFKEAFKTYDLLSQGYFIHATPTLFNAGTRQPQMSSCFLIANKGDSIEGITDTFSDVAKISASAGGIGLHIHNLRASGSHIKGSGGTSHGIMPYLKSMNEWSRYWDQGGGKRKGSFAIYLEPWHKDIEAFLDIRKNHGKEEMRARELFPALWIPDLFMERVEANGNWTLFCPNEVLLATGKSLSDCHSKEFRELYSHCEALDIGNKISARNLWEHIITSQIETGTPFMLYKDACNSKSNQQNLGTIKSSNLCTEIIEYSNLNETAVCNLASIALPKFIINGRFDHNKLVQVTKQIVKNLNQIIDWNYYPTKETFESNTKHRPVGIGIQGLSDVFAIMKISFDSSEAKELNKEIFETIYYAALESSNEISSIASNWDQDGDLGGAYVGFEKSPASKGILQFDMWGITPSKRYDWKKLKKDIIHDGLRNSLLLAPMPTASTSQILGNNECFEPFNSNLSTRSTLAGTFPIINKHLVRDLEEIGMWNKNIKNKLIVENGSIQNIPEIPVELKERYKTAYEISQKIIIDMAADRGAYICQSQSMNIFMNNPNISKLSSMHFYGWKAGLKTGMYYLRTKAAVDAIKFTVEDTKNQINCSLDNKDDCEACGS
jgi:ribonucleoside-diphosphate reductase alpha chain